MNKAAQPWTALPEAAALLASCAVNPPATRRVLGIFGPNDGATIYTGDVVRQLGTIHRREADRIFAQCEAARDYSAFEAHCHLSVQAAVAAAVEGVALQVAA